MHTVKFKLLPTEVYVLPTQVLSPFVTIGPDLKMKKVDYQWLSESLGARSAK